VINKRTQMIWLFGFMSGFTIMISSYTLNYWLSDTNINLKTIGIFSLISLPYAINFLWAPIFDLWKLPYFFKNIEYHRISWLILMQISLSISVFLISFSDPNNNIMIIGLLGLMVSLFASAQDTILGALRTELVAKLQQGQISGNYIFGYRIGMMSSSSGAIYLSQFVSWQYIYVIFGITILLFPIIIFLLFKNTTFQVLENANSAIHQKVPNNFLSILFPGATRKYWLIVIVFLILYRLPDNFISMMINPFLIHIGYNAAEIALAGKLFGASAAIIGGLLAGKIMQSRDLYNSLWLFGILHLLAHLLYIYQNIHGKNIYILCLITGVEGISGGMMMAAYIALIASLCEGKFRSTQYAFFSSMMGLSRSIFPAISGYIVSLYGWNIFYIFVIIMSFPALILLPILATKGNNLAKWSK
jgi:PAT family beta-lactamase induction signal transducer AmpG